MTKNDLKKLIKSLTEEILAEDFKGEPNHAAAVKSDELTAQLSENDKNKNIVDLEKLLKNPDPSRAKDYGSVEKYKQMLRKKIERLKGEPNHTTVVENDKDKNIADLEKLLKNPDPSRAKDYGSVENYKQMLRKKIERLKGDRGIKNENCDPFRDIVKKYAGLYRDNERSRR
jgi:DnaJ-domain-containing protein 1